MIKILEDKRYVNAAVALLLLIFFLISAFSVVGKSWTYDETDHFDYGVSVLNGDATRPSDSKMPVSAWNALPIKMASYMPENGLRPILMKITTARLMTTLFSMLTASMVFYWSRKWYGIVAGLISLFLFVFDPNLIAHSQVVTTDAYIIGTILLCSFFLWRFASERKWQDGLWFAVMLGLAQIAKYTAISLYVVFAVVFIVHDFYVYKKWNGEGERPRFSLATYLKYFVVVVLASIVIINIGFLFNKTITPLSQYEFKSELFRSIQSRIDFVVPTPYPFLQGIDLVVHNERSGVSYGNIYLLGQTRATGGFDGYYIVASLLKVPIATQLIIWSALIFYFTGGNRRSFVEREWFLLLPVLFYTIYFNFFYGAQIGIRYYLIVFPLLYVFAGSLFQNFAGFTKAQKTTFFVLAGYLIVSVLSYYPNYLAYFNEIVWDRKTAYKYLADSNIEWGQDEFTLKAYRAEHPEVKAAPETPEPWKNKRMFYISVNRLVGVTVEPETFAWLRENFEPVGMIAPTYLLFEIDPESIKSVCERTNYCNAP